MKNDLTPCIAWYIFRTLAIIVNSDIFSHIAAYLEPYVFLTYSEPCHVQNHGIFRTQDIFISLLRYILVCSKRCVTLAYWDPCHIQNCGILRTRGTFRHIDTYSIKIVIIALTFFHFQQNLRRHKFFNFCQLQCLTESTYMIRNLRKERYNKIKLTFSSENTFYDRKESSLTKYYRIRSK